MRHLIYNLGLALTIFTALPILSGHAVTLSNGKTYFDRVPQLLDAYATQNVVTASGAAYFFKVSALLVRLLIFGYGLCVIPAIGALIYLDLPHFPKVRFPTGSF